MKKLFFTGLALFAFNAWSTESKILGIWLTQKPEKNARIKIEHCADNDKKFCGKIVWLEEPTYEDGSLKIDKNNENPDLQSRPLMGMEILSGFIQEDETSWSDGTIYNPEDGKIYSCTINLNTDGEKETLDVRGYVGVSLFGKTQTWVRVE